LTRERANQGEEERAKGHLGERRGKSEECLRSWQLFPVTVKGIREVERESLLGGELCVTCIGTADDATRQVIDRAGAITDVGLNGVGVPPEAESYIIERHSGIVQSDTSRYPQTVSHNAVSVPMHVMIFVRMGTERGTL
jgi:hypothetical protein